MVVVGDEVVEVLASEEVVVGSEAVVSGELVPGDVGGPVGEGSPAGSSAQPARTRASKAVERIPRRMSRAYPATTGGETRIVQVDPLVSVGGSL